MTTQAAADKRLVWAGLVGFFGVFAGLCTIFALVVTLAEGWQEHAQARWPQVNAQVERCYMHQTSTGRRNWYYIDCSLSYTVGAEQVVAHVYSASVPSREVPQYPPNQIAPYEEWVDRHPPGTVIALRYNPAKHNKVALVATDMPRAGGPHTANDLKLLGFFGALAAVLLTIARIAWPRSSVAGAG